MPRQDEPDMKDATDKELHRKEGVAPYPVPNKSKVVGKPIDDEATSTPENNFERARQDADGEHLDAVDKMRKTLTEEGAKEAWREGHTQGAPDRKPG
jgi:hypothetical protein